MRSVACENSTSKLPEEARVASNTSECPKDERFVLSPVDLGNRSGIGRYNMVESPQADNVPE